MLIIEYDAVKGKVIPDGLVENWANEILKNYKKFEDVSISVGSVLMIDATRLLVMRGKIDHKEMLYKFKKQFIKIDKYATLSSCPTGFCDAHLNILFKLIGWNKYNNPSKESMKETNKVEGIDS